jgi:DNA-binding NarL/FixJ family response regulator
MNILIADDYELVRYCLVSIIKEEFPDAVIYQAENGSQMEEIARANQLDIIISDMAMPDKTGLDVLKQLRSESIKTPVLFISMHPENQYALRVLKAGASGYISKSCSPELFINAVKMVLAGKKYISPEVAEILVSESNKDQNKEQHEQISDRELQVLKQIASGKSVTEIARELLLSVATISTYRHRLLEKMNFKTNAQLIHYAIDNRLA